MTCVGDSVSLFTYLSLPNGLHNKEAMVAGMEFIHGLGNMDFHTQGQSDYSHS